MIINLDFLFHIFFYTHRIILFSSTFYYCIISWKLLTHLLSYISGNFDSRMVNTVKLFFFNLGFQVEPWTTTIGIVYNISNPPIRSLNIIFIILLFIFIYLGFFSWNNSYFYFNCFILLSLNYCGVWFHIISLNGIFLILIFHVFESN